MNPVIFFLFNGPLGWLTLGLIIFTIAHLVRKILPSQTVNVNVGIFVSLIIWFFYFVFFLSLSVTSGDYFYILLFYALPITLILSCIGLIRAIRTKDPIWTILGIISLLPSLYYLLPAIARLYL